MAEFQAVPVPEVAVPEVWGKEDRDPAEVAESARAAAVPAKDRWLLTGRWTVLAVEIGQAVTVGQGAETGRAVAIGQVAVVAFDLVTGRDPRTDLISGQVVIGRVQT